MLSGKVAVVVDNAVTEIRDLGAATVQVRSNVLPLVEVLPDLAEGESYGPASYLVEATRVVATFSVVPPERRLVPKSLIVARLYQAGKLAAAQTALAADIYARERWYAPDKPGVYADDAEALALLEAIGADAAAIMA
jgi:hypothetical protein